MIYSKLDLLKEVLPNVSTRITNESSLLVTDIRIG